MRQVTRKVKSYRCDKCGTEYPNKADAKSCEAGTCEKKKFGIGDAVRARHSRFCMAAQRGYQAKGRVVAITGPEPYDPEVMIKGFGISQAHGHIYWYEIEYRCPACRRVKSALYPAEALLAIRERRRP